MQLTAVGLFSHLLALLAFAGLAVAALARQRDSLAAAMAAAALVSAIWAGCFVAAVLIDPALVPWISRLQTLKTAAWLGFLLYLLHPVWLSSDTGPRGAFWVGSVLGFVMALQFVADPLAGSDHDLAGSHGAIGTLFLITRMAVAVTGLVLAHNFYLNSRSSERGGQRLLAIGLGGLFLYDLNYYTLAFLLPPPSSDLYNIRGAVSALLALVFLFAMRDSWAGGVRVSRSVAFQTVAFSGVGFYLIAMSLLSYALKLSGGSWGTLLQVTFLAATLLLGAVALVSNRFRAWLRAGVVRNFYQYRYDYRSEWLRFIATVSAPGDAASLPSRAVQAVASILEARGGWLLVPDDDRLVPLAHWQMPQHQPQPLLADGPLMQWLVTHDRAIDLDLVRAGDAPELPLLPAWLQADTRFWLAMPVTNRDALAGVMLIGRSVLPRRLDWEDEELLKTLARQVGSYIAESSSQAALDEARRFEEFNRRFAFILHDIKNLVSQLSLLARNAQRHADNPEFRADMVETLNASVDKMNALLAWLSQRARAGETGGEAGGEAVAIDHLLGQIVRQRLAAWPTLGLNLPQGQALVVNGHAGRLEQMFAHLLQNAIDASRPGSPIRFDAVIAGDDLLVTLADHGHGMSARFMRQELFQPFHSSKPGGFGIGAYEAREICRAHGGRLDVASREGEGTTFTVRLPLAAKPAAAAPGPSASIFSGGRTA